MFHRVSLVSVLLAATAWCQTPISDPPPPFAEFAAAFGKAHHVESDPANFDVQAFFVREAVFERVGPFDLIYPRTGLESKPRQEELRAMASCIIELEALWLEWFGTGASAEAARADLALLKRWLATGRPQPAKLSDPKLGVLDFFAASDKERDAAARVTAVFQDGTALGYKPKTETRMQILLAPTRKEFLEFVAFFGWADPDHRAAFWDNGAIRWTECFWNAIQVLSLEDPAGKMDLAHPWDGTSMNLKWATGAVEHVSTRSAHSLCTTFFGYALDPAFESGMCQNTSIALYGRNNARSGGSGRGNSVDGISMFVPGGQKSGGRLPGYSADSPWRATAGSDWFVKPLRTSQRVASKDASSGKEKTSTFEVTATDNVKKLFVRAPFLGDAAANKEVPAKEFLPDYLEFFRAYKSCFVHWLFEEGAGKSGKPSRDKFAELLRLVASSPEGARFEDLLSKAYGLPWSGADPKPENLEWTFLNWLSHQK
ncbi:MAG TPA: hypothetical protein VK843_19220 [Planctomycetota bacterium]|nr:hypothetical protein [Planctomycetota bacterium]